MSKTANKNGVQKCILYEYPTNGQHIHKTMCFDLIHQFLIFIINPNVKNRTSKQVKNHIYEYPTNGQHIHKNVIHIWNLILLDLQSSICVLFENIKFLFLSSISMSKIANKNEVQK